MEGCHGWSPPLPRPCRCADAEAYELSQGELSNGVFVSFLKRWLLDDEKITVLLDKVAEGEWRAAGTPGDGSVPHQPPVPLVPPQTWAPWKSRGAARHWSSAATSRRGEH